MKKKFFSFIASLVAACSLCAFVACGGPGIVSTGEKVVFTADAKTLEYAEGTVVKDYYITVIDYLLVLQERGGLEFEGYEGEWGYYITSVNGTKEDETHFWLVYTDLVTVGGDGVIYSDPSFGTYEYNGKTLNSASYGVSALPCLEGYTYALVYSSYSA